MTKDEEHQLIGMMLAWKDGHLEIPAIISYIEIVLDLHRSIREEAEVQAQRRITNTFHVKPEDSNGAYHTHHGD